ncbi:DinB family protein [Muricauda sp. CAU 1633]|uniref:DinB family protein n=1 Tax=Allomuricauda sp. CAU 1633 TaxID=2816036 RepID=UPI001A8CF7AE|nr:DinB family protein [Muricauda sp. CAU 1633]MBO0322776.1 DinB family protein [Muricauda sp. CAU 1633]
MKHTPQDGFPYYYELVQEQQLSVLFSESNTYDLLASLDEGKAAYRYAPGKWSIKQIVGHITDHERIKMFRAFQLSRNEEVQLWGYDQEALVKNSRFDELTLQQLLTDYVNVRKASQSFVDTLSIDQLQRKRWAKHHEVQLEDFLKSVIGHETHHLNIIKERYL